MQELFLSLGYNVFRYGMENTIPGVMDLLRGIRSDVAEHIRQMPDFVIQNRTTKDVYFAEVKFRANGEFAYHNTPTRVTTGNFNLPSRKNKYVFSGQKENQLVVDLATGFELQQTFNDNRNRQNCSFSNLPGKDLTVYFSVYMTTTLDGKYVLMQLIGTDGKNMIAQVPSAWFKY